jgi:hypothetical protein
MLNLADPLINFLILLCIIYQINILKNIRESLNDVILKLHSNSNVKKDPEKDIHGDLNARLLGIQQNRFSKTFRNYSRDE